MLFTLAAFALVLAIVVLAHEAGHFFTAKLFGVRVNEFGIGYPPRLFAVKHGETEYSVNALPLGGFVKLAGEEDPKVEGSLASKSHAKRITILAAGAVVNALLPIILFTAAFALPHDVVTGRTEVAEVSPDSPAAAAGIEVGDVITKFDGRELTNNGELSRLIILNLGEAVPMEIIKADGTVQTVSVTPRWDPPEGQGSVGIRTALIDRVDAKVSENIFSAIGMGLREAGETMVLFKNSILSLVFGAGGHSPDHRRGGAGGHFPTLGIHRFPVAQPGHPEPAADPGAGRRQNRLRRRRVGQTRQTHRPADRGQDTLHRVCHPHHAHHHGDVPGYCEDNWRVEIRSRNTTDVKYYQYYQ